jgi:hypothetical protein
LPLRALGAKAPTTTTESESGTLQHTQGLAGDHIMCKFSKAVRDTNGKLFSVRFIKKDGSAREMVCRTKVRIGIKGVGHNYVPADHNLRCVWDIASEGYRMINYATMYYFKCGATEIKI